MDNNVLKIYTNYEQPFVVKGEEVVVSSYRYQTTRMSVSPTITATIKHRYCLDDEWTGNEYVTFRGERYYIKQIPTSSKANDDSRYVHELVFVSEREILKDVLFYDVVGSDESDNKYVSNSTKVYFFGTIHEYASRLNASLATRHLDYSVVVDSSVANDESKEVSFEDKFISEVIQEVYNIYEIPFYFVGKVIHFGEPQDKLSDTIFEYGAKNSLLSVKKTNANKKIVTHITGHGSSENLPSYYPNPSPTGVHTYEANGLQVKDINYALLNKSIKIFEGANLTYKLGSDWGGLSQSYKTSYSAFIYGNSRPDPTVKEDFFVDFLYTIKNSFDYSALNYPIRITYKFGFVVPARAKISIKRYATFIDTHTAEEHTKTLFDLVLKDNNGNDIAYTINSVTDEIEVESGDTPIEATLSGEYKSNDIYVAPAGTTVISVVLNAAPIITFIDEPYFEAKNPAGDEKTIPLSNSGITLETIPTIEGGTIKISEGTLIPSMPYLMPSIYRKSLGTQRFYKAKNYPFEYVDGYIIDSDAGEYVEGGLVYNGKYINIDKEEFFVFDNIYNETSPKEGIVNFEDTKPTIEATGYNTILDVAYDEDDNNELNDKNEYIHPYFYVKLQPMDFNLFDHALEGQAMSISMKTGDCSACTFDIQVNDAMRNPVQVKEDGTLERDDNGRVVIDVAHPQDKQNNTLNKSVWIALMKDNKTYATTMPNDTQKVKSGNLFVILNIALPQSYIDHAESILDAQLINAMYDNNSDKFSFTIKLSRIYLANNPNVLQALDENSLIKVGYNGREYGLYVSNYTYTKNADEALPEVSVDLTDTLSVSKSALSKIGDNIKREIYNFINSKAGVVGSISKYLANNLESLGSKHFVSKKNDDTVSGEVTFEKNILAEKGLVSSNFFPDVQGYAVRQDENGNWIIEADLLKARKKIQATELEIQEKKHIGGDLLVTRGAVKIVDVWDIGDAYRCIFDRQDGDGNTIHQMFTANDQAICQTFNVNTQHYYWRLVVNVSDDNIDGDKGFVDLSKTDCDTYSDIPQAGDTIIQLGHRTNKDRQNAIILSPNDGGSVKVLSGINNYNLTDKNYVGMGVNPTTNRAYLYGYGDMFFGDRKLEKNFITYQIPKGETEPVLKVNADIIFGTGSTGLSNLSEFKDVSDRVDSQESKVEEVEKNMSNISDEFTYIQQQASREYTIWFFDYVPTLENEPAKDWVGNENLLELHNQDLFFSDVLAKAWRFVKDETSGEYSWEEITDERTLAALRIADEANTNASHALTSAEAAVNYYNNVVSPKLDSLQQQIDGAIDSYFYDYEPTLENEPAVGWVEDVDKESHLNDTFTNLKDGRSWRWTKNNDNVYAWTEILDTATVQALALAGLAKDTADKKRRTFVGTPTPPYDEGDLWVQGESGDILKCDHARENGELFDAADWSKASKYTDNSKLDTFLSGDYAETIKQINQQLDKKANTYYQDDDPSLDWTEEEKLIHVGDLWFNTIQNKSFMWNGSEWKESGVPDEVFDKIDGKSTIYLEQPTKGYEKGDMWILMSDTTVNSVAYKKGDILTATVTYSSGYNATHWTKLLRYVNESDLDIFFDEYEETISDITNQIDGKAETYYQDTDPSQNWDDADKPNHIGDLWYKKNESKSYVWNGSLWQDADYVPQSVYDTIDGKSTIFVSQPSSYDKGDMWILSEDREVNSISYKKGTILVSTTKYSGYNAAHWVDKLKYTDDTLAQEAIDLAKQNAKTFQESIDALNVDFNIIKQQTDKEYTIWFFNHIPTLDNEPAIDWTEELKIVHEQDLLYYREKGLAYRFVRLEDGSFNWEEITDADTIRALELIQQQETKLSDFDYLKQTFEKEDEATQIANGVVVSRTLSVKDIANNIVAMLNGSDLGRDDEHGKVILASGIPTDSDDLEERIRNATTRIYEDGHIVAKSGEFNGKVNATDGTFNGTIISKSVYTPTTYIDASESGYTIDVENDVSNWYMLRPTSGVTLSNIYLPLAGEYDGLELSFFTSPLFGGGTFNFHLVAQTAEEILVRYNIRTITINNEEIDILCRGNVDRVKDLQLNINNYCRLKAIDGYWVVLDGEFKEPN